jgi:hypothetical protein
MRQDIDLLRHHASRGDPIAQIELLDHPAYPGTDQEKQQLCEQAALNGDMTALDKLVAHTTTGREFIEWLWRFRVCSAYIPGYIRSLVSKYTAGSRLASVRDELYLFGKGMDCFHDFYPNSDLKSQNHDDSTEWAVNFYRRIANRCRMAVIYILICGRLYFGRDIARMIAKCVHDTRHDIRKWIEKPVRKQRKQHHNPLVIQ